MINKKRVFYLLIIFAIFLLGLYFRFNAYLFARPLWGDECYLFSNIYMLNYLELFRGLNHYQSAPPIFLVITKFIISHFGVKELSLRFFPFLVSIIAIPVFYKFSKIFLEKKWSIIAANLLFAINTQLIYYAEEYKQYSTDVLVIMLLFIFLNKIKVKNLTTKTIWLYILVTMICPLISLPSYFIIAGWFLKELFSNKNKSDIIKLFGINLPLLIVTVLYYIFTLSVQRHNIFDVSTIIWEHGFLSFNLQNNFKVITEIFKYIFYPCDFVTMQILLFITGIVLFIKTYEKDYSKHLLLILAATIICSAAQLYPMYQRVSLYLTPIFIIVLTKCLDYLSVNKKFYSIPALIIFSLAFWNYNFSHFIESKNCTYWFYRNTNARILMKNMAASYKPQDTVFVYAPAREEYKYYKLYYNFKPTKEILLPTYKFYKGDYYAMLQDKIKTTDSCWFFFASDWSFDSRGAKTLKRMIKENKFKRITKYETGISYLLYVEK